MIFRVNCLKKTKSITCHFNQYKMGVKSNIILLTKSIMEQFHTICFTRWEKCFVHPFHGKYTSSEYKLYNCNSITKHCLPVRHGNATKSRWKWRIRKLNQEACGSQICYSQLKTQWVHARFSQEAECSQSIIGVVQIWHLPWEYTPRELTETTILV